MNLQKFLTESRAVSPVIGVILMVAITVILAAVIGTFVLGLGDQVSSNAPQASFSFDYAPGTGADSFGTATADGDGLLTITHDGGDSVKAQNLNIVGSSAVGSTQSFADSTVAPSYSSGDDISAGSSIKARVASTDTVRVTWKASSGDSTATLAKWTGPDA